eukprot:TRINITY_DN27867_c1_g1_i1.p1 TRINITY_DN27867_c1_g1~~TRINITY_DN27867_c1_g1_i1.p1  ORF type:complete len:142 (+),score=37.71 TRINITY_DN27867_c1_g1_i1:82-507(+)
MASAALLWECTKKNSSFIRKSPNMPVMSAEPNNLCGLNSFKFSGLTGSMTLGLSSTKAGAKESIVLQTQHSKKSRGSRPSAMFVKTGLPKNSKKGVAALDAALGKTCYRRDLLDLAKAKYTKLTASFKKKKVVVKSRRNKK